MLEKKPSYAGLVLQVVREAPEPLPFSEILERVFALFPITTRNPKSTIRNAISQSRLVVSTGDGRYGWKYRLITGAVIRLPLTEVDLTQRRVTYSEELRDALWPAFFEIEKHNDRRPVQMKLPDGESIEWSLILFWQWDLGVAWLTRVLGVARGVRRTTRRRIDFSRGRWRGAPICAGVTAPQRAG